MHRGMKNATFPGGVVVTIENVMSRVVLDYGSRDISW
jgi:hypothetical protein